jgi:hypothetical protein
LPHGRDEALMGLRAKPPDIPSVALLLVAARWRMSGVKWRGIVPRALISPIQEMSFISATKLRSLFGHKIRTSQGSFRCHSEKHNKWRVPFMDREHSSLPKGIIPLHRDAGHSL